MCVCVYVECDNPKASCIKCPASAELIVILSLLGKGESTPNGVHPSAIPIDLQIRLVF